MKKFFVSAGMLVVFLLTSCQTEAPMQQKTDYTREYWQQEINRDPSVWAKSAHPWFYEDVYLNSSSLPEPAQFHANLPVPYFNRLKLEGDFMVQLVGTSGPTAVTVYGPIALVKKVHARVARQTLIVTTEDSVASQMTKVAVRIAVNHLSSLMTRGNMKLEGVRLETDQLRIESESSGNMYLSGDIRLQSIVSRSNGDVNIFGADTKALDIEAYGRGSVNVSGYVLLHDIKKQGPGNINIVGSDGGNVSILASGSGKIGVDGVVYLKKIIAHGDAKIYLPQVSANDLVVDLDRDATVGLDGRVNNLYVFAADSARFLGRHFCSQDSYVKTRGIAHANVTASNKIFAKASEDSSIYYFGSESKLSAFAQNRAAIIPVTEVLSRQCGINQYELGRAARYPVAHVNSSDTTPAYPRSRA